MVHLVQAPCTVNFIHAEISQEKIKYTKTKEQMAYSPNIDSVIHSFPPVLSIWVLTVSYLA